MDYTDDVCMNLFTQDQKDRMRTVLSNSPRRLSLLSSPAINDPIIAENDLGIREIISPQEALCDNSFTPQVELRNYGTNEITSFSVSFYLNGDLLETKEFEIFHLTHLIFLPHHLI